MSGEEQDTAAGMQEQPIVKNVKIADENAGQAVKNLAAKLTSRPILLDGGMGHQLKAMGVEINGIVGSMERFLGVAMANSAQPDLVRDAHVAFIDAGADVITTNNYAVVPSCLATCDDFSGNEVELRELIAAAGRCAQAAREARPQRKVKIAGCMPPLNESYRADRVGDFDENLEQYRLIASSIEPFVDIFLCETLSTADEAKAAVTAACEVAGNKPVWVSWTLHEQEPKLRSGESIHDALVALDEGGLLSKVQGFLFNCTSPEVTCKALPVLRADPLLPEGAGFGGYANGFVTATSGTGEYRDLSPGEYYDNFVKRWIETAASNGNEPSMPFIAVGGCCGIFPPHIARIRAAIDELFPAPESGHPVQVQPDNVSAAPSKQRV